MIRRVDFVIADVSEESIFSIKMTRMEIAGKMLAVN
jgi:hypothetical protein